MSGQLHAPAFVTLGPQSRSGRGGQESPFTAYAGNRTPVQPLA
jgi:hypothetical protein